MADDWGDYGYRVRSSRAVTPVIRELWCEPTGPHLRFQPGQYVLLSDAELRVPQRSYSVANAPRADGAVSLLVTVVPGGPTSTWAHGLAAGDDVLLEGPFGSFMTRPTATSPVLLLGAGSGLAPVRALAEALLDPASPYGTSQRHVTLYFSGRTEADVMDRKLFESWRGDRFEYRVALTRVPGGRRIPARLADEFPDLAGVEVFAAGPPGFVAGCEAAALALGAAATDIRTEEFFADPIPWRGEMPPVPGPDLYQEAQ